MYFGDLWSLFFIGKPIALIGWGIYFVINIIINLLRKKINDFYINILFIMLNIQTILIFIYIIKIPYDLLHYLSWFYFSIAMLYFWILLLLLYKVYNNKFNFLNKEQRWYYFTIFILILTLTIRIHLKQNRYNTGFKKEYLVLQEIKKHFIFDKKNTYKIYWGFGDENHNNWVIATGIVLDFYRNNIPVCIDKQWEFMFGKKLVCKEKGYDYILYLKRKNFFNDTPIIKKIKIDYTFLSVLEFYNYSIFVNKIDNEIKF
ncbi:MAG: hypothetical protein KatS3mg129_0403 [Leptospiraceae bacterium]|nr:MAG: hypothetical protein KatS3mg129_0403 [Leptospiraceae bacterium]